jgi:hypothetical protein
MNIEDITSLIENGGEGLYSNLSVTVPISENVESGKKKTRPLFNSAMAEASQYMVFEEIFKSNNCITFNELEDKVYDRYDIILKEHNPDFIFSLKMPFYEWVKLQIELGNILIKTIDENPMLSISRPIEELLKTRPDVLYNLTGEILKEVAS